MGPELHRGAGERFGIARALAILGLVPLGYSFATWPRDPVLVIEAKAGPAPSEPRADAERIAELEAGETYDRLAAYPGWVQVRLAGGREGWVSESSVFALDR